MVNFLMNPFDRVSSAWFDPNVDAYAGISMLLAQGAMGLHKFLYWCKDPSHIGSGTKGSQARHKDMSLDAALLGNDCDEAMRATIESTPSIVLNPPLWRWLQQLIPKFATPIPAPLRHDPPLPPSRGHGSVL